MTILAIKFLQYIYLYVSIDFLSFCGMNRITIWLNDMFLILQGLRKGTSSFFLLKSLSVCNSLQTGRTLFYLCQNILHPCGQA